MSTGLKVEDTNSMALAKSTLEQDSSESRDQPSCNGTGICSSKENLLRSRYRKTVAKLQQRTGIAAVIVFVIIIWGLLVCLIVSYKISKIRRSSSENETQTENSSSSCLQTVCNTSDIYNGNHMYVASSVNLTENITCSDNFYLDEESNLCKPECGDWRLYSAEAEAAINALTVISAAIGTIGGIVVLVVSCINYKQAFTFPSALVRYQTATVLVFNVLLLVARTNPKKLFCSSRNLFESSEDPTPFCSLIGFAALVSYWQAAWWWLIHIAVIFWGLRFPFHAHKFESTNTLKYLHTSAIVLVFIVPWIPVGVVLGTGGHTFGRYPPLVCNPRGEDVCFLLNLPIAVLVAIGTSLLTNVLWTVCKRTLDSSTDPKQTTVIEVKILIVLCYFLGTGIVTFIAYIVREWQNIGMQEFNNYFTCEGYAKSTCDRSAINSTIPAQAMFDASQIILGLFPAVNLVYVVNFQKLKTKWKNYRLQQTSHSRQTNTTKDH